MATGSEVGLIVDVYEKLAAEGVAARVVSMPSWNYSRSRTTPIRHRYAAELHPPSRG